MKGKCCRCFPLPNGPEELYEEIMGRPITDGKVLLEILRYIGLRPVSFARYTSENARSRARLGHNDNVLLHFYTCTRFDQKTGLCRDYALRPHMCRVYNHGDCEHPDCESFDCPEHPETTVVLEKATIEIEVKNEDSGPDLAISG